MDELQLGVEHQHGPGRPELALLQLEEPEGTGEITVTVRDDGKLAALGGLVAMLCSFTFRDEADIIMDLTATWLSVQTPITCAPTSLKSPSLSLNSLHSLASTSVSLSSMKRRTVNLPSSFSEVTRTNFSPFLVS